MFSGQHAERQGSKTLRTVASLVVMVVAVVAISFGLRTFVFSAYEIPSGSMEDTIMTGDLVFSEKVSYYSGEPKQGDIVTFEDPLVSGRTLIKRVIATGGQTVDLVDGKVVVDGVALDEPYTEGKVSEPFQKTAVSIGYPYTVPQGCLWVMGDNRTNSQDSRYFAAVDASTVTGHAVFTYWPINHIGLLS